MNALLNPAQAGAILGVHPDTVREYARKGLVPARKIGKHWRFLETDLFEIGKRNTAACSTNAQRVQIPITGLNSSSVESRLDAALARRIREQPKITKSG